MRAFTPGILPLLTLFAMPACSQRPTEHDGADKGAGKQEAPSDGQTTTPSDFARFVKVGDGGHFDTAITTYEKDGVQVIFYGAVHIADKACYTELNKRFETCDVLLYELVGPEDYRPTKDREEQGFNPIGMLQQGLKNGLQLSFQLDEIDYQADNFVHADMTPQEFQSSMAERGESLLSIMFDMMVNGAEMQREQAANGGGAPEFDLVKAFRTGEGRHRMRVTFAQQLEQMEMLAAGGEGSTLLEGRNEKCLKVLRREIDNGHDRIGIYYGAAHLPHMEQRLVDDMGFKKVKHEWLQAWDCTRRSDPGVAIDEVANRRKAKIELLKLAKVGAFWRQAHGDDAAPPQDLAAIAALQHEGAKVYDGPFEDPWGTAYRVENRTGKQRWVARSAGPDKRWGSKDDLRMNEPSW
ncbi:MAG: hypothetical protein KAI24_05395 [Planctomycetes bacterium]|nr:hypothetical protein [Planctomycetota bacterium]